VVSLLASLDTLFLDDACAGAPKSAAGLGWLGVVIDVFRGPPAAKRP